MLALMTSSLANCSSRCSIATLSPPLKSVPKRSSSSRGNDLIYGTG